MIVGQFAFDPVDQGTAYLASTVGVYRSENRGRDWDEWMQGMKEVHFVVSIVIHPTDPNILYAALSSFDDATPGKPGHVFKTTNALSASPLWVNVSPQADLPFNVVAVDPSNPSIVYAGTDAGLWRSLDAAATWLRMGPETGLPNAPVYDIKINPATGRTVVFTYGRGAYALDPEV